MALEVNYIYMTQEGRRFARCEYWVGTDKRSFLSKNGVIYESQYDYLVIDMHQNIILVEKLARNNDLDSITLLMNDCHYARGSLFRAIIKYSSLETIRYVKQFNDDYLADQWIVYDRDDDNVEILDYFWESLQTHPINLIEAVTTCIMNNNIKMLQYIISKGFDFDQVRWMDEISLKKIHIDMVPFFLRRNIFPWITQLSDWIKEEPDNEKLFSVIEYLIEYIDNRKLILSKENFTQLTKIVQDSKNEQLINLIEKIDLMIQ
jgi:hypothetical protein